MLLKSRKLLSLSGIIRVPQLRDVGVCIADLKEEREDTSAILFNGKVIPLGHELLDSQEVTGPIHVVHH